MRNPGFYLPTCAILILSYYILVVVEDCSQMVLFESMCMFECVALLRKNIMNFPRKMKLSSITNTFEMVIHGALHQLRYKCNDL